MDDETPLIAPASSPREAAALHADLGLPIPRGTRLRLFKRLLARLGRLFIHRQVAFNHAVVEALAARDAAVAASLERHDIRRGAAETRLGNEIGVLRADLQHVQLAAVEAQAEAAGVRGELETSGDGAEALARSVDAFSLLAANLQARLDAIEQAQRAQQSLVDLFLREVRRDYPAPPRRKRLAKLPSGADRLYAALEDAFRGTSAEITERQRPYLRDLETIGPIGRVLDVGSGRGEWLALLREAGIDGYGVDQSREAVQRCRALGLVVVRDDAFEHLRRLEDASLSVVSAFHFVEHLEFEALLTFLDQGVRVLAPGGLLILETPNPRNLVVGSSSFYLDPTHERPMHPLLLEFLVRSRGFDPVEVRYLHPAADGLEPGDESETARKTVEPVLDRLNELLYGAQDYAVLARRAPR